MMPPSRVREGAWSKECPQGPLGVGWASQGSRSLAWRVGAQGGGAQGVAEERSVSSGGTHQVSKPVTDDRSPISHGQSGEVRMRREDTRMNAMLRASHGRCGVPSRPPTWNDGSVTLGSPAAATPPKPQPSLHPSPGC